LERVLKAGAVQERLHELPNGPAIASCCDPFGHGFCLLERRKK
jgi:uncharacterized glyoxalase superfamily protein PhnB